VRLLEERSRSAKRGITASVSRPLENYVNSRKLASLSVDSVSADVGKERLEPAQRHRIAGRGLQGLVRQFDQLIGMEARRQPFQPHRRDLPVAIATRTVEQVDLAIYTFDERQPQFLKKRKVIASGGSERCIEITGKISHIRLFSS